MAERKKERATERRVNALVRTMRHISTHHLLRLDKTRGTVNEKQSNIRHFSADRSRVSTFSSPKVLLTQLNISRDERFDDLSK